MMNVLATALAAALLLAPSGAQQSQPFKPEELDQILAPIALYPDDVLAQILMAATYPLEVVQAQRWTDANKSLTGDPLAVELEKQAWDPSVKSLVNFPQVLKMMSEKLDWTVRLGDAFLSQKKEVMDTVQKLRKKAQEAGNLKTDDKMKVEEEDGAVVIESTSTEVVYIPTYDPTIVYGVWWYPAYPPYYWYPPGYVRGPGFWFGFGITIGVAWGYGWGHCHWGHGDIDIDIDRNVNVNPRIDRDRYRAEQRRASGASKSWKHDPAHRQGTPYRDKATTGTYGRKPDASRDAYRGRDAAPATKPAPARTETPKPSTRDVQERSSNAFSGLQDGGDRARVNSSRGVQSRGGGGRGGGGRR